MALKAQAVARRRSNKRMHATADTTAVKYLLVAGRRVMRGVRCLVESQLEENRRWFITAGIVICQPIS